MQAVTVLVEVEVDWDIEMPIRSQAELNIVSQWVRAVLPIVLRRAQFQAETLIFTHLQWSRAVVVKHPPVAQVELADPSLVTQGVMVVQGVMVAD